LALTIALQLLAAAEVFFIDFVPAAAGEVIKAIATIPAKIRDAIITGPPQLSRPNGGLRREGSFATLLGFGKTAAACIRFETLGRLLQFGWLTGTAIPDIRHEQSYFA
jgi:hypothetical protein